MDTNLGYLTLEGPGWLTLGQLQAYPWKLRGITVQTSYVGGRGIKIERIRARNIFLRRDTEIGPSQYP